MLVISEIHWLIIMNLPQFYHSCWNRGSSFLGKFFKSVFLSYPMRLVHSPVPDPFPSAFPFSKNKNETPQLLIAWMSLSRCTFFLPVIQVSLSYHCIASCTMLSIKISEMRSNKFNSSKMMWSNGDVKKRVMYTTIVFTLGLACKFLFFLQCPP